MNDADKEANREAREYLRHLGNHAHALCPEHRKPYAVSFNSPDRGKVKICGMCINKIAREDALWIKLSERRF